MSLTLPLPLRSRRWLRRTFAPDRRHRVDFLIAGTQKGGTNTLDAWLRQHPRIAMADRKEVHYFDDDSLFDDREADYAWYHAWFARDAFLRLTGEATPAYLYWQPAAARIHRYNPAMKFVLLLRDPVSRAYSSWNMQRQRGVDPRPFAQAVDEEIARLAQPGSGQVKQRSYLDRGFYAVQVERILGLFPSHQILCLRSENLRRHPQRCFDEVCGFLGVEPRALTST
ncbi:MAG: sulfotransferase domain-containing protein, partial [Steroidobacteraceae bacterium]